MYRPGNIPSHARASEKASQDAKRVSACASFIPYEEPRFSFAEVCSFTHVGGWDPSRLLCPGVVGVAGGVYFAPREYVSDPTPQIAFTLSTEQLIFHSAHLQTITTLPTLCNALAFVSFVDSAAITDGGVKDLITYCPNLKVLSFINAINLTDASFEVAVTQLASLEILRITGRTPFNPNSPSGKLTTKGSIGLLREQELGQTNKLGKKLKKLDLTGQAGISLVACRKLSGERNGLEIEVADVGPLVCTFWQGHLVGVENNPAFKPRGPGSQLLIGSEEGDQYSDNEDEMYDNFHTHDIFAGATLDPTTGLLMPPNGEYWEWNFVGV